MGPNSANVLTHAGVSSPLSLSPSFMTRHPTAWWAFSSIILLSEVHIQGHGLGPPSETPSCRSLLFYGFLWWNVVILLFSFGFVITGYIMNFDSVPAKSVCIIKVTGEETAALEHTVMGSQYPSPPPLFLLTLWKSAFTAYYTFWGMEMAQHDTAFTFA